MKYDVAISFAGEQREEAREIAQCLTSAALKVFFDEYHVAELWGRDLYEHLSDIYQNQAQYCVILVSKAYANKVWTTHERRNAQARALREKHEYILPVRFDDTPLPGLSPTVAYLDFHHYGSPGICQAIFQKLKHQDSAPSDFQPEVTASTPDQQVIDPDPSVQGQQERSEVEVLFQKNRVEGSGNIIAQHYNVYNRTGKKRSSRRKKPKD